MSWRSESGRDGLSIWRGQDSIVNVHQFQAMETDGCLEPLLGIVLIIAVLFIIEGAGGGPLGLLSAVTGGVILLVCAPAVWAVWKLQQGGGLSTKSFFDEKWVLWEVKTENFHGLMFRRVESDNRPAESWKAPLAHIARVEAGSTKQWIGSRQLGSVIHPVSDGESQAFLFMNDGSRRVICSINDNREPAATLAHSVRSWLEAMKARPTGPLRGHERAEGFDP